MKNKSTFFKENSFSLRVFVTFLFTAISSLFSGQTTVYLNVPGNGNWTVPCGVTSITVEVWGAGGGGGGSNTNGSGGSGGGSGGYSSSTFTVTPNSSINYTIGLAGAAGAANGGDGGNGGNSSILGMTANGGTGGKANATNPGTGQGGTASGGTTNTQGQDGTQGATSGGAGGSAPNGGTGGTGGTNANGGAGTAPGGGGGGGERGGGGNNRAGGAGGNGWIKITYTNVTPANPGNPTSNSPQCNPPGVTLTRAGTPPAGVTWYWQTAATGTSTANSGATYTATTSGTYYLRAQNDTSSCWSTGAGSVAITISQPPSSTASSPTPTNNNNNICYAGPGAVSSISWAAAAGATSYDVYFGAGSLPGTPNANVTTTNFNTGALLSNTTYYWRIVPRNSCGITTGSPVTWSFTTRNSPCYCTSSGGNISDGITGVIFNSINNINTPVNTGYTDYTTISTSLMKTFPYDLSVYINTGGNFTNHQSAYIDWNGNGLFTDLGESYNLGTATNVSNGLSSLSPLSITVPAGATTGAVRMRIQSRYYNPTTGPCQTGFDGEVEDYTLNIIDPVPCAGTPTGGTASVNPTSDMPGANYIVSATGYTIATGLTYQWQSNTNNAGWVNAGTATSIYASYTATAPSPLGTTVAWRLMVTCNNSSVTSYSSIATFTSDTCRAQSTNNYNYFQSVQFVGSLIPDTTNPNTGYSANGYGDYTSLTNQAKQIPGGVINLRVVIEGSGSYNQRGYINAWVDWNKDGNFDNSEKIHDNYGVITHSEIFGFVVPNGTSAGMYRLRIRTRYESFNANYGACGSLESGETEDYQIEVINDCAAKITGINTGATDGIRCGSGPVTLTATATAGTTEFRWYNSQFGGTAFTTTPTGSYTTGDLSITTTYYVTAWNGSCESVYRTPIIAHIDPTPSISFTTDQPEICGDTTTLKVTSAGDKEEVTLVNEKFNSGLGVFSNQTMGNNNTNATWQNHPSPYVPQSPPYYGISPAISSGYNGGNFAAAVTDVGQASNVINRLNLNTNVDASQLTNLKVDFDLYYEPYIPNDPRSNLRLEASSDGGSNWATINTFSTIQGNPGIWSKQSFNLPASYQTNQLRIRIVITSYGSSGGWFADIAAVDNIRVYGMKDLSPVMNWTSPITLYNADCSTPYSGAASEICIKPTATDIENYATFAITATSSLSNGCSASGTINITNNTKVWNPASSTNWASGTDWKPSTPLPSANNCVIIKKSINIPTGTAGLAKNIIIEPAGKLNIKTGGSLTVTDFFQNQATQDDVVVENGGNLVQINDTPSLANSGSITAENLFTLSTDRKEYNYVISPVVGQNVKTIYPGNPTTIYHSEAANWFYTSDGSYIAGRGLGIKEPATSAVSTSTVPGLYKGAPFNGELDYSIAWTNTNPKSGSEHGWNLTGNPYPSALDLIKLYNNSGNNNRIEPTFYFWDNRGNSIHEQQGSGYTGPQYAMYNVTSGSTGTGTAAGASGTLRTPNQYVKVGVGFMVKALSTANGEKLHFENAYRATGAGPDFHGRQNAILDDRYWLTMQTPAGLKVMNAVVYFQNGNNALSSDDTNSNEASDDIYTILSENKLNIQGKAPFDITDILPLGVNTFTEGMYKIHLYDKEGVFANGQNIYLNDKQTGILTNLSEEDYSFYANAGVSENRFEIVYTPSRTLGTDAVNKTAIEIFKDGKDFAVRSFVKLIKEVEIYDLSGRLIFKMNTHSKEARLDASSFASATYILKVKLENDDIVSKKIRK